MTIDYDMIPDYKNGVPEWMIYMTNAQYTTEDEREKSFFEFSLAPGECKDIDCAFLTYENSLKDTGLILIRQEVLSDRTANISLDGNYNNKT